MPAGPPGTAFTIAKIICDIQSFVLNGLGFSYEWIQEGGAAVG